MRTRRVGIDRLVLDGLPLSREQAEEFRAAFADELTRLLRMDVDAAATSSRLHASIEVPPIDLMAEPGSGAAIIARSVARALTGR